MPSRESLAPVPALAIALGLPAPAVRPDRSGRQLRPRAARPGKEYAIPLVEGTVRGRRARRTSARGRTSRSGWASGHPAWTRRLLGAAMARLAARIPAAGRRPGEAGRRRGRPAPRRLRSSTSRIAAAERPAGTAARTLCSRWRCCCPQRLLAVLLRQRSQVSRTGRSCLTRAPRPLPARAGSFPLPSPAVEAGAASSPARRPGRRPSRSRTRTRSRTPGLLGARSDHPEHATAGLVAHLDGAGDRVALRLLEPRHSDDSGDLVEQREGVADDEERARCRSAPGRTSRRARRGRRHARGAEHLRRVRRAQSPRRGCAGTSRTARSRWSASSDLARRR